MARRTIWVDCEDCAHAAGPGESQRIAFALTRALLQQAGTDRIRLVRQAGGSLREVPWTEVEAAYRQRPDPTPVALDAETKEESGRVQAWLEALPPELGGPLARARLLQHHAARNWRDLALALRRRGSKAPPAVPQPAFEPAAIEPGDALLVLGVPWAVPGYAGLQRHAGLASHLLLHDLVPIRHPEWCAKAQAARLEECLPLFDALIAGSRHTAEDVSAYARERGLATGPVHRVPFGADLDASAEAPVPDALPRPGSYALIVSTIEARKNHALAVRVWRRLAEEVRTGQRAPDSLPDLVFAGRVGCLVADLLQQLENMRWLGGRIHLVPDPSEAELRALYQGCRFTIFPSWFEGWALPVAESLAFGKPCLASNAAAIPEAGGALCRYFDPGDTAGAYRAVASLLDDPGGLASWEDRIRAEFRPTRWSATAEAILELLA